MNAPGLPLRFLSGAQAQVELAELQRQSGAGALLVRLDGAALLDDARLQGALARALRFPSQCGEGWDATLDALRDLSWLAPADGADPEGVFVVVDHAGALWRSAYRSAAQLCEVWLQAALELWLPADVPFQLLFIDL